MINLINGINTIKVINNTSTTPYCIVLKDIGTNKEYVLPITNTSGLTSTTLSFNYDLNINAEFQYEILDLVGNVISSGLAKNDYINKETIYYETNREKSYYNG